MSDCVDHGVGTSNDYARNRDGVRMHRAVLALKLGVPEPTLDTARHTCDNKRCINAEHIIHGTQHDNVQDAVDRNLFPHGEAHYAAKLTEQDVLWLRSVYIPRCRVYGTRALARQLNVSQWVVSHAIRGLTWRTV